MQTPGSSRPARRLRKPKRFEDSDSEDEVTLKEATKKFLMQGCKRKVTFYNNSDDDNGGEEERKAKRLKLLTAKKVDDKEDFTEKEVIASSALQPQRVRIGPKSVQEKLKWRPKPKSPEIKTVAKKSSEVSEGQEEEEGDEDTLESMLTEYREMFGKPVVDMTKKNVMANGDISIESVMASTVEEPNIKQDEDEEEEEEVQCKDCMHYREELDHLEEMIKLKDCELQQVVHNVNMCKAGGQKQVASMAENIEKRLEYHRLHLESQKKLRSALATAEKWESLFNAEAAKAKDLELRCEALELKLRMEQKRGSKKPGHVEVSVSKLKELTDLQNYHRKNCTKLNDRIALLNKENSATLKSVQKNENEYKNKFIRMKKHYQMLLDHYIQKDARFTKRKDILERKMALYKDVGSRQQIIRDAAKYLNRNQMAFLEGQLSTERTLCGKGNSMPPKYKEFLLSLYQTSVIAYKVLKSYNFNIPPTLSIQQLSQSEVCQTNPEQYDMLMEQSKTVPAYKRTLRALNSDEEDQEVADLVDESNNRQEIGALTDEEAEDGVDGDYGDVQPEEGPEEEEEEGGADYLSDDEPNDQKKMTSNEDTVLEEQVFEAGIQGQLENQLSNEFTTEPQFDSMEAELEHGVMTGHTLVEQVDVIDHVVQEVTEQLVDTMETIPSHQIEEQIEINDSIQAGVEMVSVDASGQIVQSGDTVIVTNVPHTNTTADSVVVTTHQLETQHCSLPTVVSSAVESDPAMEVVDHSAVTAETGVAERGADMPLI